MTYNLNDPEWPKSSFFLSVFSSIITLQSWFWSFIFLFTIILLYLRDRSNIHSTSILTVVLQHTLITRIYYTLPLYSTTINTISTYMYFTIHMCYMARFMFNNLPFSGKRFYVPQIPFPERFFLSWPCTCYLEYSY